MSWLNLFGKSLLNQEHFANRLSVLKRLYTRGVLKRSQTHLKPYYLNVFCFFKAWFWIEQYDHFIITLVRKRGVICSVDFTVCNTMIQEVYNVSSRRFLHISYLKRPLSLDQYSNNLKLLFEMRIFFHNMWYQSTLMRETER